MISASLQQTDNRRRRNDAHRIARGFASALAALGVVALAVTAASESAHAAPPRRSAAARRASVTTKQPATRIVDMAILREEDGTRIVLWGSNAFDPTIVGNKRPYSTTIRVRGTWAGASGSSQRVGHNGVESVNYGQQKAKRRGGGGRTVVVRANADMKLAHSVVSSSDKRRWEIKIWSPNADAATIAKGITVAGRGAATLTASYIDKKSPRRRVSVPVGVRSAPASAVAVGDPSGDEAVRPATRRRTGGGAVQVAAARDDRNAGLYPSLLAGRATGGDDAPQQPQTKVVRGDAARFEPGRAIGLSAIAQGPDPSDKRVSLDFIAADINDVLKAMSLQSGINIVTGNDVKGNITVALSKVPLSEALDMVTRLSGYKYDRYGSAFVVGTPLSVAAITAVTGRDEVPVTEFIPYRYISPQNLSRALAERFPGMTLPPAATADPIANPSQPKLLVLTDKKSRVLEARDFVEKLEQAVSIPTIGATTDVYRIKYASAIDLVGILQRLVPTISVQLGPSQGFISGSTGASASYASTGAASGGGTPITSGQQSPSAAAAGAGTANPAGAVSSGVAPVTLLLTGAPGDIARAKEVLDQLDIRTPQLQFEAKVVDVNRDDLSRIGIRYDFNNGALNGIRIGEKDPVAGTPLTGTIQGGLAREPAFGAVFRTPYSLGLQLDALVTQGRGRVVANPNLSAIEGQPAVVFIGDQIKYVINIQQTTTGQTIQTETATVGVTLKVTGKSSPDGTITLYIHPEVSTVTSFLQLASGIALPQISTRFVDTTIRVKDGETIGIGGLINESDIRNVQKVPLLGDIPFLGQLFRRTEKTKQRRELVILITSRVVKE